MSKDLNPERARIFRVTHTANLRWVLTNGLHCANSPVRDPAFVPIGNPDLIDKRTHRQLPPPHQGTLSDYVPFYFTPYSIMMFNIKTGYGGVTRVPNSDIVIFVSTLHHMASQKVPFLFTNQHAYPTLAKYFSDLSRLDEIDWATIKERDFKHDPDDPGRKERYQAEALIWKHVPLDAFLGVCCYSVQVQQAIEAEAAVRGSSLKVAVQPGWYFT